MTTSTPSTSAADERQALLDAAREILRGDGSPSLRVEDVLGRAGLGTRAFYRHFDSKDQLVLAVFAAAAQVEADRLRSRMSDAADPLGAVVAWIDGRLDLAFDEEVRANLQHVSRQAQAVNTAAPGEMAAVHAAMLAPLVEQIRRGAADGTFSDVDPLADALSVDSVTWRCIEMQWAGADLDRDEARVRVLAFCLRGLGADLTSAG